MKQLAGSSAGPLRRTGKLVAWLGFWMGYAILPVTTHGFSVTRFDCNPLYGAALFMTFFAWLGYFGLGSGIAVLQLVEDAGVRLKAWIGLTLLFAVLYLGGVLPAVLQYCQVFG